MPDIIQKPKFCSDCGGLCLEPQHPPETDEDVGECPRCHGPCPIGDVDCPSERCAAFRAWAKRQPDAEVVG